MAANLAFAGVPRKLFAFKIDAKKQHDPLLTINRLCYVSAKRQFESANSHDANHPFG